MRTITVPQETTTTKLLSYTLNQPGVCTAVTGIASLKELTDNMNYLNASNQDKDYAAIIKNLEAQE